ncbi:MAG: hypothetical protein F4186_05680, partial [Boseongicola sp. SB0676_bin_33]|nr:hypothetical protein [Boseongicola sp. SB0676_bin_33]
MSEGHASQVLREELVFTVEMALAKASGLWPGKRQPGDHDRLKAIAAAVVEHLEMCRMRRSRLPPIRAHGTPNPCLVRRESSDAGDTDGVGESPPLTGNAPQSR